MTIEDHFRQFYQENGEQAFDQLSLFFAREKEQFYQTKRDEYSVEGVPEDEIDNKIRQGWVSVVGSSLEKVIKILLESFCEKNQLKLISDRHLRRKNENLSEELKMVKEAILVNLGDEPVLPDADLIIYRLQNQTPHILCILSVKNSLRERYTQTPYWKRKLLQSELTQNIKVYMVTPDKDSEISENNPPSKSRIVMEYELDGIYLAKEEFQGSDKVKSIQSLANDLENLL